MSGLLSAVGYPAPQVMTQTQLAHKRTCAVNLISSLETEAQEIVN